jgi:hypothetical protein
VPRAGRVAAIFAQHSAVEHSAVEHRASAARQARRTAAR